MNDTICAIATPPGAGAIAIVRVSGPKSGTLARTLFRSYGSQSLQTPLRERFATYGEIIDEYGCPIDHGLAIMSHAPHSYTGEDTLELQVHGSPIVAQEVLRTLIAGGARAAGPGEFTRRAFLNGKLDLHAAASVADLIAAESRSAARAALANLGGGLANEVRSLRLRLAKILEELAGAIDFPDEVPDPPRDRLGKELDGIRVVLERLRHDGEAGRVVREGVSVAIVGPPNAGKSSLLNAFLGEERVLVSEIPGTTRDTIEESITIDGVLVRLIDTAGIRTHADRLESAGIERTQRALATARIALIVLDGSQPLSGEARVLLEATRHRERIVFYNKSDLGDIGTRESDAAPIVKQLPATTQCIVGTLFHAQTLEALRTAVAYIGWGGTLPDLERPHLAAAREFDAVNEALKVLERARATLDKDDEVIDLIASDLQRAFTALGHVTGDVATEELLDGIFARFCIGK